MTASSSAIHAPPDWFHELDWGGVFGNDRLVEVEIGCGKGRFLLWATAAHPDHNFLGVDRLLARLRKVDRKIQRRGLSNIRLVRIEAGYFVGHLVPAGSVGAYHVYFPDPWPKRRHHRRRLFGPSFVADLVRTLGVGGAVNVATDHRGYFEEIQALMGDSGEFAEHPPLASPPAAVTEFERIFAAQGQPIHRARWTKRGVG